MSHDVDMVFERHYRDLVAWSVRHAPRHWGDPEDFVHQAYLRCRKHWSAERSAPARGAAYFYRALRWVLQDAARQHQRRNFVWPRRDAAASVTAPSVPSELTVQEAFQVLTPRERAVCWGFLQGHSRQQVCRELGLSLSALAVHLSRAQPKLLRELTEAW